MSHRLLRHIAAAFVSLLLLIAAPAPRGEVAAGDDGDEPEAHEAKCTCAHHNACWHFLHAPVPPPDDPCWCQMCTPDHQHAGDDTPEGWNTACFTGKSLDCFLRRHAASWKITCSECLAETKCCDFKNQERCPACGEGDRKDPFKADCFGKDARASAAERYAAEQKLFEKHHCVVLYSRHFYVATDIQHVQIKCQNGGLRYVDAHEYGHIMLERAEKAYREFTDAFHGRVTLLRPMAIILPQRDTTGFGIREAYFKNKNAPMIYSSYAGQAESSIAQGFCFNGICVSLQQAGNDDTSLHQAVRHLMANIMVTCWIKASGDNKSMPRWVFEGVAHWLGKSHKDLHDEVWYCIGEAKKVSGSGKTWMKDLFDTASKGGFGPMQEFIDKNSLGALTYEDHKRAWGIFEICMAEWREPFVNLLADLRREVDQRDAFQRNLGCTPEQFHQRWIERLLGTRKPITADKPDKPIAAAGLIANPTDPPAEIAEKIRTLGKVTDPAIVARIVDLIGRCDSDIVRETGMAALRKVDSDPCKRAIWETGLTHPERFARAYAARLCRKLKLVEAKEALRKVLDDPFWMARAEAGLALATIRDFDAQAKLREMCEDSSAKVRIGAMDALAIFDAEVNDVCVPIIAKNINHADWQVRVATCQVLRRIGDEQCIDALIGRLDVEAGRVAEDALRALRAISGEDLGNKPDNWKKWWEREGGRAKERHGFDKPAAPSKNNERYGNQGGTPPYYGVELFSQRIGYVIDVSRSTNRKFVVDSSTKALLKGTYSDNTIFEICQGEASASIDALDQRAFFNVIAFGTDVRKWERAMVPANESNKHSAVGFVHSYQSEGETNFYGALSAALDLDDGAVSSPDFRNTPDTMVFLTDGTPTKGDITEPDTLLEWYSELNRYFRVRTHMIAFGRLEVDEELLRKLAGRNDGQFTQIFETN